MRRLVDEILVGRGIHLLAGKELVLLQQVVQLAAVRALLVIAQQMARALLLLPPVDKYQPMVGCRAGHFRYFGIFSIIKIYFFHFLSS